MEQVELSNKEGQDLVEEGDIATAESKESDANDEKKDLLKVKKSRLWDYSKPERHYLVIGGIAAILNGMSFPILSLVFSEMIITWYDPDTVAMRDDSMSYSYLFYALAVALFCVQTIQVAVFELIGERMTKRLRVQLRG